MYLLDNFVTSSKLYFKRTLLCNTCDGLTHWKYSLGNKHKTLVIFVIRIAAPCIGQRQLIPYGRIFLQVT